jgi:hypothetical protein
VAGVAVAPQFRCGGSNGGFTAFPSGTPIIGNTLTDAVFDVFPEYFTGPITGQPFNAGADAQNYVLGSLAFTFGHTLDKPAGWTNDVTDFSGVSGGNQVRTPRMADGSSGPIFASPSDALDAANAAITAILAAASTIKYGSIIRLFDDGMGGHGYVFGLAHGIP